MNRKQRMVLWMGGVLMVLMGLFPPIQVEAFNPSWKNDFDESVPAVTTQYRYQFVGSDIYISISDRSTTSGSEIGWTRLRLQWLIVVLVMFVFLFVWRDKRNGDGGLDHHKPTVPTAPDSPQHISISA